MEGQDFSEVGAGDPGLGLLHTVSAQVSELLYSEQLFIHLSFFMERLFDSIFLCTHTKLFLLFIYKMINFF